MKARWQRWMDTTLFCTVRYHKGCDGIGASRVPYLQPITPCACRCHAKPARHLTLVTGGRA